MKINPDNLPEWAQSLGTGTINDIRFSPNGDRIAVTRTSRILIYDAQMGLEIALITADMAPITAMVFSVDGDTIMSGSEDGVICFSKASDGRQSRTVHDYEGDFIAFSPNGNSFAARVWGCWIRMLKRFTCLTLLHVRWSKPSLRRTTATF